MAMALIDTNFEEIFVIQCKDSGETRWRDWCTADSQIEAEELRDERRADYPKREWRATRKLIISITTEV